MPTGFPPYIQTSATADQYRLNHELPPELALKQQALNRRQQIANLMLNQATQLPTGRMAGKFYVAPSWTQNAAALGEGLAGLLATRANEQAQQDIGTQSNTMLAEAVKGYQQKTGPQTTEVEGPGAPVPTGVQPGQGFTEAELNQPTGTRGTMRENIAELYAQRSPAFFQEGPRPTTQVPATQEAQRQAVIDLMANQHPQVASIGKILAQQEATKAEREANREFMTQEKALDREVRREGIESNALMRAETLRNTIAMKEAQMAADERAGLRNENLRRDIADQTAELKKLEIQSRREDKQTAADAKKQLRQDKDLAALQSMTSDLDRLTVSANQLLDHPGLGGITGLRGAIPDIPGSQAADARSLLDKLKSQVGLSVLQNMRNNSKTGGALGNVSDNEGKRLENNLASLASAQSIAQMKSELQGIVDYVNSSKDRMQAAYDSTYGDTPAMPLTVPATNGKPNAFQPFHDPAEEEAYQQWKLEHK